MKKSDFVEKLEQALEIEPGTIQGNETLSDSEYWDSLASLSFVALADQELQLTVTAGQIADCSTMGDLFALLGDKIED